jgi:hypothetical protein
MFGIAAAVGAMAASLPASADNITVNLSTGTTSQTESGNVPAITVENQVVDCSISFTVASLGTPPLTYTPSAAPGTHAGNVTAAAFGSPGSTLCASVVSYSGTSPTVKNALSATNPWTIGVTAASSTSQTASVIISNFMLYTPLLGYCYGPVSGTYSSSTATSNPNTLAIPTQTLTHALPSGTVSGTCTIDSGVLLNATSGLISIP